MHIEVFSDVVCPWCFLGKRRLEAALAERPQIEFEVRWRPFELNPNLPRTGVDRANYLADKFGGRDALAAAERRLVDLGRDAGIDFRFDRIAKVPHTRAAHRLIAAATDPATCSTVVERLLSSYFEHGRDIGDVAVLVDLAEQCGLDGSSIARLLAAEDGFDDIASEVREAQELGVNGVPTFVFDERYLLSGAQPPHVLLQVIDQLATVEAPPAAARARG
ncbi:MAG TPA: DsbA family oxidoreductase [Steroidobacteraceae bacterium]|nr:DsbA family oxidoreductase [Steroidobacteraceae bacterium]